MPLVVTEEGSGRSKSRGSATSSSSGSFQNNPKVLRRSRTLNEDNTLERPKQTQRYGSQSLDDLIRCAICLEQLCRPTMLPCQHTFCLICLDRYVEKKSNVITCPTCRLQAFLESLKTDSATKKPSVNPGNQTACARCSNNAGNEVVTCEHCSELFCKSCHLLHTARLRKSWSKVIDDLFAENQRLSMIKEESEARSKKLSDKIQATVAIQVQQLYEKQDRLLSELKRWRSVEADRLVQVQQLCEELLSATPTIGSSEEEPVPNADVLKRSEAILERARLCGTTRLMFDSEELTLTCQSTETETETVPAASVTSAVHHAPVANNEDPTRRSSSTRRNNRRVTFSGAGDPHLPSFPLESSLSLSTDTKKPAELQSEADEKSIHYRSLSSHPRQRITSSVLQRPAGVAVSPWTGEIYVAATDSHRVYVIDKNGKIAKSLGSPYRSNERLGGGTSVTNSSLAHATTTNANYGTFLCPFGIAFSAVTEEIYVTDKWLNCIQVFNKEGGYVRQIGVKGTSPGHFRSPEGIAVDPKGLIYVCDTCNDRVQVLDRNGVYIRELGAVSQMTLSDGKLYQKREFSEPSGVAVSPDGSVVAVVDSGNCRIKVFNPTNGELIVVFGFRGTQRGQFQQPECLAVDDKGFILVGDNGNGRIQIFRPNGSFVRALGSKGGGPGQFNWISGLTLSKDMDIISTDFKNHCIQIF